LRVNPPIAVIGIVATALTASAIMERQQKVAESCSVLLAFLKTETRPFGSGFVIQDYPQNVSSMQVMNEVIQEHPEFLKRPEIQIPVYVQMIELNKSIPTKQCPQLTAWLSNKKIEIKSPDFHITSDAMRQYALKNPFYLISMPGLNRARTSAILNYQVQGAQGGKYEARFTKLPNGNWVFEKAPIGIN
jgi:hypothetical protein